MKKLFVIILSLLQVYLTAQTQYGPNNPSSALDGGGDEPWTNITNVYTSNNTDATVFTLTRDEWRNGLIDVQGFGFSIPLTYEILGVRVDVEGQQYYSGPTTEISSAILLDDSGIPLEGSFKTDLRLTLGSTDAYYNIGGATDTWGTSTLTPSMVNDSDFGVQIEIGLLRPSGETLARADIDHIRVTIWAGPGSDIGKVNTVSWSSVAGIIPVNKSNVKSIMGVE